MRDYTYVCCRCGATELGVTKVPPDAWPDAFHCPEHPLSLPPACSDWPRACQHTPAHDNGRFTPEPSLPAGRPTP